MRARRAVLPLLLVGVLSVPLAGCSDGSDPVVGDDGVVRVPTLEPDGLDAPSGEPLVPDSEQEPGAGVTQPPPTPQPTSQPSAPEPSVQ